MRHLEMWESSAGAWIALEERGDRNRTMVLDPAMLRLAGEVRGLEVCDVGCGEGRFSRMLSERGARVTGLDPTSALIRQAKLRDVGGQYMRADGESIPLGADRFDLTVCYLVLIDVPDFRSAVGEMARITKPGGRILVANMNSFTSTYPNPWIRDESGKFLHVQVRDYFGERADFVAWADVEIVNYHRPFEDYVQAFLSRGLRLTHFEEPRPSDEAVRLDPKMLDSCRVPNFHVMQWRKE